MQPQLLLIIDLLRFNRGVKMNKFEAVLLISPEISNNLLEQNIKNFEEIVANSSGKITNTEDWGLRDLSYDIKNFKKLFTSFSNRN